MMSKLTRLQKTRVAKRVAKMPSSSRFVPAADAPLPEISTESNVLMNLGSLQSQLNLMARCAHCACGKLELRLSSKSHGSASYVAIYCNSCDSVDSFWSAGSRSRGSIAVGESSIMNRSELIYSSVLAGRIMGIGWAKIHLYNSFLNIPCPISCSTFICVQADILVAAKVVAEDSMASAVNQLRTIHSVDASCPLVEVVGTFDGAYQQRSGEAGGGFSRYCFAATIAAETGKVISYGVACNNRLRG